MKYLKTYKIFENGYINQKSSPLEVDVVNDVHDMLLDLKDDGVEYVLQVSSRTNKTHDYHWYDYVDFVQYGGLTYSEAEVSSISVGCNIPRPVPIQDITQRSSYIKIIKQVFERMMNYCDENGLKYNLWACPSSSRSAGRYCIRGENVNQDPITVVDLDKDIYENSRLEIFIFNGAPKSANESIEDYFLDLTRRQRGDANVRTNKVEFVSDFKPYEDEVNPHIEVIKDILVDLTDENWDEPKDRFKVEVKAVGPLRDKRDKLRISINIHRDSGFKRGDVYPVLDRVDEYLTTEGYYKWGQDVFDGYNCNILYRSHLTKLISGN